MTRVRVGLVDDHVVFRMGLRALAQLEPDLEVVAEASDADGLSRMIGANRCPDVVVIESGQQGLDRYLAIRELVRHVPPVRVLALSIQAGEDRAAAALDAGASGYALKTQPVGEIFEALRTVARGQRYLAPALSVELVEERLARGVAGSAPLATLSKREREVFVLLARGFSTKLVSDELGISAKTVETHRVHIHRKLGVHSVAELIHYAVIRGLLPP